MQDLHLQLYYIYIFLKKTMLKVVTWSKIFTASEKEFWFFQKFLY